MQEVKTMVVSSCASRPCRITSLCHSWLLTNPLSLLSTTTTRDNSCRNYSRTSPF